MRYHNNALANVTSASRGASGIKPSTSPNYVVRIYVAWDRPKAGSRARGVEMKFVYNARRKIFRAG